MTGSSVINNRGAFTTSLSLLERVKARGQGAWERMVHLYAPLVNRWLSHAGLQRADLDDLRQEIFLAVDRSIEQFRRDGRFRSWLRTIALNKLHDFWRKARRRPEPTAIADLEKYLVSEAEESAIETAILCRRALDLAFCEFEDTTWRAFWRVVIDGCKAIDVAAELNLTANAVYCAKARVLARLREEFAELIE